jgi:hypothetical protein
MLLENEGEPVSDATERLTEILRAESERDRQAGRDQAQLLRRLSETTKSMTPAERTWVLEATEEELRGFVRAIRRGCEGGDA